MIILPDVEYKGLTFKLLSEAQYDECYENNGKRCNSFMSYAERDDKYFKVYFDIINEDAEEICDMCDFDNPSYVKEISYDDLPYEIQELL